MRPAKEGGKNITALIGKKETLKTEEMKSIQTGNISRPGCSFKMLNLNLAKTRPLISEVQMGPQDKASKDKNSVADVPAQIMMQRVYVSAGWMISYLAKDVYSVKTGSTLLILM